MERTNIPYLSLNPDIEAAIRADRAAVEAAVSGIQRHGVGRLGLQQIRPVRVARELGR